MGYTYAKYQQFLRFLLLANPKPAQHPLTQTLDPNLPKPLELWGQEGDQAKAMEQAEAANAQ